MIDEKEGPAKVLLRKATIVFWDFDGVIKDSVAVKTVGFEQLFLPYGKELAERVRRHHEAHGGVSRYEKIPIYLEWAGETVSAARVQDFCEGFARLVQQAVIDAPWVAGVREYLLAQHSRQCFVLVTATPQEEIQQILQALNIAHCFNRVFGAPASKTGSVRELLRELKCPPEWAVLVGDSEMDLKAAQENGVPFLLRCTVHNQTLQERYSGPRFEDLSP